MPEEPKPSERDQRPSWLRLFVRPVVAERGTEPEVDVVPDDRQIVDKRPPKKASGRPRSLTQILESRGRGRLRVRERVSTPVAWLLSLIPFILLIGLWFWLTAGETSEVRRLPANILPSPAEMFDELDALWFDAALMRNIVVSLVRVLAGFAVAAVIAIPLGILMGSFGRVGAIFGLFATLLSYLPIAAIVPLTIAWWGTGEKQKIGFLALGTVAYLLPMVVRHIRSVDHQYVLGAYSQGATATQVVSRVLVPISMPDIANAMRLCLGIGWTYIVLAEVIRTAEGMGGVGNLIINFQRRGHVDHLYLTILAILLVGALLDLGAARLTRALFPYRAGEADE